MDAFDLISEDYDRWYDEPEGRAAFVAELACLRSLIGETQGEWLEVGVGTGRFAQGLGVRTGIDPSRPMLDIAAKRGIRTVQGVAEALPFAPRSFDGVLLALTLCFVRDVRKALAECARVLRPVGRLLVGIVPAAGPWGRAYARLAAEGHPVYSLARFLTPEEVMERAADAGLAPVGAGSTLFWEPGESPDQVPRIEAGLNPQAGFVALLFEKPGATVAANEA